MLKHIAIFACAVGIVVGITAPSHVYGALSFACALVLALAAI